MKKFLMVLLALGLSGYLSASTTLEGGDAQQLKRRYDPDTKEIFQSVTGTTLVQMSQTLDSILAQDTAGSKLLAYNITNSTVEAMQGADVGDGSIFGVPGAIVNSATYDGFGNPLIYWDQNGAGDYLMGNISLAFDNDANDYANLWVKQSNQAYAGGSSPELLVANNTVAVGGVAVYPAIDAYDASWDLITGANSQLVVSAVGGYRNDYSGVDGITSFLPADTDFSNFVGLAVADNQVLWGGVALSPASSIADAWDNGFDTGDNTPTVMGQTLGFNLGQQYSLPITGGFLDNSSHPFYDSPISEVFAQHTIAFAGSSTSTDTYATTGDTDHPFPGQNYTWQIRPVGGSITSCTVNLRISIDGGATYTTIDTLDETDLAAGPVTISAKPGALYNTEVSALTLDTATGVAVSVHAQ